jgi:serine/threonine protein kinase/tetratricopeptide (TPR) repeat protein
VRLSNGATVGPYVIEGPLGAGGMGEVYRACDPRLGRDVAVKILISRLAPDPERISRFERESRAAAALAHPNILVVFDVGRHEGLPYLVTELLVGESVRERLRQGPLSEPEVLRLGAQLVRGVAAAHALTIVHRDLKPENLFLTKDGALKILDFGLAKLLDGGVGGIELDATTLDASEPGQLLGTPAYMAPEQLRGEEADERTDLFAIGTVLFEMATGVHPFRRKTGPETTGAVLHESPSPPPHGTRISPHLERLLLRCLEKDPEKRFQSATDLLFAVEALADERPATRGGERISSRGDETLLSLGGPQRAASVAVLPFVDMSPTRDQDYLCEGIAEEVINALTHLSDLRVAARSSSFQFRGQAVDLAEVASKLSVSSVLEGSVRKLGNRLRVNVQLIDAGNGYHLWSERFDREIEDVFAIEDEIAESVATALRGVLSPLERRALQRPEGAVEAYEYVLRGRVLANRADRPSMSLACGMYEKAIEIDPGYAPAWASLAAVFSWRYEWFGGGQAELERADDASRHALELAPDLGEAHAARGSVLSLLHRYPEAEEEYIQALRLNPNSFEAYYLYGRMCFAWGKIERSAEMFRRAAAVQRDDFQSPILLGQSLRMLGRKEEAAEATRQGIRRAERRLAIDPIDARALSLGANALADEGRTEEALAQMARALEIHPDEQGVLINAACLYAHLGKVDEAIGILEDCFAKGFGKRDWIENDPDYDNLRANPRFQALLDRLV